MMMSVQLAGGLVLLYFGADWLVRGAATLGARVGLTPLVIGLTVVAFGTSAPELAVSLQAGLAGQGPIAVGNVVGSNIANIALILGVAALIRPLSVRSAVVRIEVPLVILASLLLCALVINGVLGRVEGALLFIGALAYTWYSVHAARRESSAGAPADGAPRAAWPYWLLCAAGIGLLAAGAHLLVGGAVGIARAFGLSEALIGLTLVAVGTSLPELATSAMASLRRQGDIAVGNVLGSNLFNILVVLGVAALVMPLAVGDVSWIDFGVMTAVALLALPIFRSGFVISRVEGAGLLVIYAGYMLWLTM